MSTSLTTEIATKIQSRRMLPTEMPLTRAKEIFLDTLACIIAATQTPLGRIASDHSGLSGHSGRYLVVGVGRTDSAPSATYANGRLGNILDFDETFMGLGHHACSTIASALAAAQHADASGRDFLEALVLGFELGARAGLALEPHLELDGEDKARKWHYPGPVMGTLGSCAAACILLGLSTEQIENALGICCFYLPPAARWDAMHGPCHFRLGSIKYEDTGWEAEAGFRAALLASQGVTAPPRALDGNIYSLARAGSKWDPDVMRSGLGDRYAIEMTSIKPWPCCRLLNYPLTALQALMDEHQLSSSEIQAIRIYTFPGARGEGFEGIDFIGDVVVEGSFSYQHACAMAASGVVPGLDWFEASVLSSGEAERLRRSVSVHDEPLTLDPARWKVLRGGRTRLPVKVSVDVKGETLEHVRDTAWGDPWALPEWPHSRTEVKFLEACNAVGKRSPLRIDAGRIMDMVSRLDCLAIKDLEWALVPDRLHAS